VITTIPFFALTQAGKELVIERAKEIETSVLINTMLLPVLPEQKQPAGWEPHPTGGLDYDTI
jgi:hypothetical protein